MTGMPAFKTRLTDTQLWQVSQLLTHANEISDSVKSALLPEPTTEVPALAQSPASHNPSAK
jgi:hypothetical protein